MKRRVFFLCGSAFALLCVLVLSFLRLFAQAEAPYTYLTWDQVWRQEADGTLTQPDMDAFGQVTGMEDGNWYLFSAEVAETPTAALLLLNCAGAEAAVRIDGDEVFRSSFSATYASGGREQVRIPLQPGTQACRVELAFRVLDAENAIYPPLAQISSTWLLDADTMAYANLYGIPAGGYALVFLLVCGLFLLGLAHGRPNLSLLVLALAAGGLTVYPVSQGIGYYFLTSSWNAVLNWRGFLFLVPLLLLAYLFLNRRRGVLRLLGRVTVCSLAVLLIAAAVSALRGGYLASYLQEQVRALVSTGYYDGLLYWGTVYLTLACAGISAHALAGELSQMQAEARILRLKNQLTLKNYQETLSKNNELATLRHEWKNQLATLDLLYQKQDWGAVFQRWRSGWSSCLPGPSRSISPSTPFYKMPPAGRRPRGSPSGPRPWCRPSCGSTKGTCAPCC